MLIAQLDDLMHDSSLVHALEHVSLEVAIYHKY